MCGRARCTLHREEIASLAGVSGDEFLDGDKCTWRVGAVSSTNTLSQLIITWRYGTDRPCENMGPGRYGPVAFYARDYASGSGEKKDWRRHKKLQAMRWGLVPSFTKPHVKPDHFMMFNARSESLHERPAFRRLLEAKRCVIFSDGYYEWQQVDKREKQPYYIYRTTGPLKFAGLYDTWKNEQGEQMYTYTILTSEASPEMKWMHTRMPVRRVILTNDGGARWLSEAKFDTLRDLLVGYRGDDLTCHPVDRRVGSTKFQSEECSKKVDIKHAVNITSFFSSTGANPDETKPVTQSDHSTIPRVPLPSSPPRADRPATLSQSGSACTTHDDTPNSSQVKVDDDKPAANAPLPTTSPFKSQRTKAFRSPIKFLFQQQHMVQQAEDIILASQAASDSTTDVATSSTVGRAKPTKPQHPPVVSASAVQSEMGAKRVSSPPKHPASSPKRAKKTQASPKKPSGKNPQRGTLLAFFQPKH